MLFNHLLALPLYLSLFSSKSDYARYIVLVLNREVGSKIRVNPPAFQYDKIKIILCREKRNQMSCKMLCRDSVNRIVGK